ncbi:unnamed protein product [Pleuronectes platessa]|uniref:Uncharacterized protein n=1 Tax=Pleuronectes platessa TaxID=8262 RepID=A0A9N7Z2A6_PLEPL|nr:unnamed protein product [Pleuronectes platessa]
MILDMAGSCQQIRRRALENSVAEVRWESRKTTNEITRRHCPGGDQGCAERQRHNEEYGKWKSRTRLGMERWRAKAGSCCGVALQARKLNRGQDTTWSPFDQREADDRACLASTAGLLLPSGAPT